MSGWGHSRGAAMVARRHTVVGHNGQEVMGDREAQRSDECLVAERVLACIYKLKVSLN